MVLLTCFVLTGEITMLMSDKLPFTQENFDKLEKLNAEMAETLQGIINGCVHPEVAIRAVFVDLAPVRKTLSKYKTLTSSE